MKWSRPATPREACPHDGQDSGLDGRCWAYDLAGQASPEHAIDHTPAEQQEPRYAADFVCVADAVCINFWIVSEVQQAVRARHDLLPQQPIHGERVPPKFRDVHQQVVEADQCGSTGVGTADPRVRDTGSAVPIPPVSGGDTRGSESVVVVCVSGGRAACPDIMGLLSGPQSESREVRFRTGRILPSVYSARWRAGSGRAKPPFISLNSVTYPTARQGIGFPAKRRRPISSRRSSSPRCFGSIALDKNDIGLPASFPSEVALKGCCSGLTRLLRPKRDPGFAGRPMSFFDAVVRQNLAAVLELPGSQKASS